MKKEEIIINFSKELFDEFRRRNAVTIKNINTVLIEASLGSAFVNESCKSTEEISKSQIIYRKLEGRFDNVQSAFRGNTEKFLKLLKIFSRNRKFILSVDETEDPFYGKFNKGKNNLYLHDLTYAQKGAKYGYKYLTLAITCSNGIRYVLDGIILKRGDYVEDYIYEMIKFVKDKIKIEVVLFDRGFNNWGIILKMQQLKVNYMIFWKKQGNWYKEPLRKLKKGEFCEVIKKYKHCRDKSGYWVYSKFVLVKQLEYEDVINDWIFATNLNKKSSVKYVKRYKKRWGIETIFRVTDDIRIYTTSTSPIIRYFLFMFTCFVYNVWKFFQCFIGKEFTLANFCTNLHKFMIQNEMIQPRNHKEFIWVIANYDKIAKRSDKTFL